MASDNELLIKLGVETSSASKQIQEITKELKQMEKQVKAVDNASDGFNSGLSGIAKKVDIYTNKIDALNTKLKVYEKTLEEAEYQMKTAQSSLDELGKRTSDNAKDWDTASKKLEIARNKYNNTVRSIQTTQLEIQNTSNEIRKLNDSFEDLKFDEFNKDIDSLGTELKLLDKQIDAIDTTTDNFSKNMSGMGEQTDLYRSKIEVLNKSITKHKQELESIKISVSSVESWLDSLGERTEENAEEWDRASDYLIKYKDRQSDLENSLIEVQAELRTTTNDLTNLNKEMAQMPFEKIASAFDTLSNGLDKVSQITQPLTTAVTAIGAGAITTAMSFEEAMAKVQAVSGATGDDFDRLSQKARQIGGDTQLSASEGAEALLLLAQAGYDTETSLGMVDAVVDLAIANQMDLAEATEIVTASISSFNLEAKDAVNVTDVLSTVASSSNTNVSDLGEAFKAVAPTASALGFSVEDTAIVLGLMANQAIQGSEAGNGLKSVLANLVKPTKNGAEALKNLGVELTNSDGTMRDLNDIVADLQKGFSGLSEEEQATVASTIVGKQQMSKFLAIVNSGEDSLNDLSKAVENSNGKTNEMRMIMEDTASGGLKELQSKLEETFIVIGNELLPVFNDLVDALGDALVWFQNLDEETQNGIIKFALFSATISPISGALSKVTGAFSTFSSFLGKIAGKMATVKTGVDGMTAGYTSLSTTVSATGSGSLLSGLNALGTTLAPWMLGGTIVAGVGLGVAGLIVGYQNLKKTQEELASYIDENNELMEEATSQFTKHYSEKLQEATKATQPFIDNGLNELKIALKDLKTNGGADLTNFSEMCKTEMADAMVKAGTATDGIISSLENFNTNTANIEVFTAEDLIDIKEDHIGKIDENLTKAYETLQTTISDQDAIIAGIMETDGLSYEEAYRKWEEQVLIDYGVFCDNLITAQSGLNQNMLNNIGLYYADYTFTNLEELNKAHESIRKAEDEQNKLAYAQKEQANRDTLALIDTLGEEEVSRLIKFNELEYLAQCEHNNKTEIESHRFASQQAYAQGIIDEEELQQRNKHYDELETASDNHLKALTAMEEDYATLPPEIWSDSANAVLTALKQGKIDQEDLTEELWDNIVEYYENGGDNINEAIIEADNNVSKEVKEHSKEMQNETESMQKGMYETIREYMNRTGATWEEACDEFGVSTTELGDTVDETTGDMETDFKDASDTALTSAKTMGTNMPSHLDNVGESLIGLGEDALTMGEDATTGATEAKTAIDSVKGKKETVTVNFLSNGFATVMSNLRSFVSSVIGAKNTGKSDSLISAINFGDDYTEDLYGLKDAGVKTISLANLDDGISAYATKDSNASSMVNNSVANYNYNNSISSFDIPFKDITKSTIQTNNVETPKYESLIHIENMTVRNDNDIKEIAKQLENYIRLHSKKW